MTGMTSEGTKITLMQWAQQPLFYVLLYNSNLNKRLSRIRMLVSLMYIWLTDYFDLLHFWCLLATNAFFLFCFIFNVFSVLHLVNHKTIQNEKGQTKRSYAFSIFHMRKLIVLHWVLVSLWQISSLFIN